MDFGVYLHIPFCASRCDYCAFATWTDRDHLIDAYLDALVRDVASADLPPVTSVFVGGGTPTRVPPGRLVEVLPEYRSIEMGIHAVYPTRKHVSPKVRLLIDFLVDSFRIPRWLA